MASAMPSGFLQINGVHTRITFHPLEFRYLRLRQSLDLGSGSDAYSVRSSSMPRMRLLPSLIASPIL